MTGVELIAAERKRQIEEEGWSPEHDAGHADDLARAGATYAMTEDWRSPYPGEAPTMWPWQEAWWKPTPDNRVRELAKAGALIAAAIDDLQNTEKC